MIAAAGLDLIVVHDDVDVDRISAVTGQRSRWIAPEGKAG